jgi:Ca2+/H+ antiporter
MLKYIPYVLMFAVATMIIYGWGLWRTMHQHALFKRNLQSQKSAQKK